MKITMVPKTNTSEGDKKNIIDRITRNENKLVAAAVVSLLARRCALFGR